MTPAAGPQSPDEVDAEVRAASDPEWYAKYGENLGKYTDYLFEF